MEGVDKAHDGRDRTGRAQGRKPSSGRVIDFSDTTG